MTQQTHPGELEHDTTGTPDATSGADAVQGERREPRWYDGPSTWQSPGAAPDAAHGAAPGGASDAASGGHEFGLGPAAREQTPAPEREDDGPHHDGSAFGVGAGAGASAGATGWPTTEVPVQWHPEGGTPSGGWGGDGGWGGPHQWSPQPAPAPKARPGRRLAELGVVAVLAAALAGGATYGAIRLTGTDSVASSSTSTNTTPAPVVQADASNPDWSATAKAVAPSVVSITVTSQQAEGQGSGVVIDTEGHILTNNHVATGAGTGAAITVTLDDGRTYDAKIVGTDPTTDLAVLQLQNGPSDLKPISIGDSDALTVGQPVMAVGNPLGLAGTVTTGIVSALDRPVTTAASETDQSQQNPFGQGQQGSGGSSQDQSSQDVVTNAIQTSAAINPGNSGGALVTASGQLIGINSSIASLGSSSSSSQSGNIGIGFAIPVKEAKSIADQLIKTGTAQHAYLGVSASDTTVTDGSSKRAAALLRDVSSGTPAASAGLKTNDAVIAINGDSIESSESLVATIHEYSVGEKVTVTVIRGGAKQDIQVTLAARPGQG